MCGPAGTGKTFLLEALGQQAVEAGTAPSPGSAWNPSACWCAATAPTTPSPRPSPGFCVRIWSMVDDIGLLAVGADAAEGLYRLVDAAYEKRSIAIQLQPAPRRTRRADAQDADHRHR